MTRAWPTATRVSRSSATWALLARWNCPAMAAAVAGLACVVRAWRTARMRSGSVAGHAALVALAALAALGAGFFFPLALAPGPWPLVTSLFLIVFVRFRFDQGLLRLRRLAGLRVLELGPQPADFPSGFFGGAFMIQSDQPFQNLFIAQRPRPAVRLEHGGIQSLMNLLQDRHQPVIVNLPLLGGQHESPRAGSVSARSIPRRRIR